MESKHLTRRNFLEGLIAVPASAALLAACGNETLSEAISSTSSSSTPTTAAGAATTAAGATSTEAAAAAGAWASGGTDLITVGYPDTSIFSSAEACVLSVTEATTEGPCYFSSDTGEDISLGNTGLPMQLCLQLVDESCTPLPDYVVEVWHCDTRGIYSGDTSGSADSSSFAGDFCTNGDDEAESSTYFRGQLTTDADGRVNFKTCFPGWYGGRTIHIHYAVTDPSGTTRLISQFCFTDETAAEICTTHDLYDDRGVQDTTLAGGTDTVFPANDYDDFLLTSQQNSDGTMLAYAQVQIDPSAVAASSGGAPGAGGQGGGPGGEPPAGGPGGEPPSGAPGSDA